MIYNKVNFFFIYFKEFAQVNLPAMAGICLGNGGSSLCLLNNFNILSTSLSQYFTTMLYFSSNFVKGTFSLTLKILNKEKLYTFDNLRI